MSASNGIKQVAMESGWLTEKFLKHLVKNFSGKEFTVQDLIDDKVVSKFMEPSKVTKKETKSKSSPNSPMKFLKENPDTSIRFIQENPKKSGSKVFSQYEIYKNAGSYTEFSELGGKDHEFLWDYRKGFVQIAADGIENFTPAIKEKPKESKKSSKKEKKPKKPKEAVPDPVEESAQGPTTDGVESWWNDYNEECATNLQQTQEPAQEPVASEELDEDLSEDNGSGTLVETVVDHPQQEANDSGEDDSDDDSDGDGDDNGFNPFNISAENSDDDDDDDGL